VEVFDLGLRVDLGFCMTPLLGEMRSYIVEGVGDLFAQRGAKLTICP